MAIATIIAADSARESARRTEECKLYVQGFDSKISTIAEQKYYASCVQRLNPDPATENELLVGKACVLILLIAFLVGMIVGWKSERNIIDSVLCGSMFVVGLAVGVILLGLLVAGVMFLFS